MNRRLALLSAVAMVISGCGRRGSPRRARDAAEDDESAPRTGRPPPPEFDRKEDE